MKNITNGLLLLTLVALVILSAGKSSQAPAAEAARSPGEPKRIGMVVGLRPGKIAEYKRLHADGNPGVRDLLNKYHMHNFSIFLHQIDGKWYEFGYYEYTGDDYEGDMARMDAEPRIKEWLSVCDPMQIPLEGEEGWAIMEQVYYNK